MSRVQLFELELVEPESRDDAVSAGIENAVRLNRAGVRLSDEQLRFLDDVVVRCGLTRPDAKALFVVPGDCFRSVCDTLRSLLP